MSVQTLWDANHHHHHQHHHHRHQGVPVITPVASLSIWAVAREWFVCLELSLGHYLFKVFAWFSGCPGRPGAPHNCCLYVSLACLLLPRLLLPMQIQSGISFHLRRALCILYSYSLCALCVWAGLQKSMKYFSGGTREASQALATLCLYINMSGSRSHSTCQISQ